MLFRKHSDFLLKNDCTKDDILFAIKKSAAIKVEHLFIIKLSCDFNAGDFIFYMKSPSGKNFSIPFLNHPYINIEAFWKFLEASIIYDEPVLLPVITNKEDVFLYLETIGKNVRFIVMNTKALYEKRIKYSWIKYKFKDAKIDLDILISKKEFIKQFYNKLYKAFKNYEDIAFFEEPNIDFDIWTKDSKIIKEFLQPKKRKTNQ